MYKEFALTRILDVLDVPLDQVAPEHEQAAVTFSSAL